MGCSGVERSHMLRFRLITRAAPLGSTRHRRPIRYLQAAPELLTGTALRLERYLGEQP